MHVVEPTPPVRRHILAVNDSVELLTLLQELLEEERYAVTTATFLTTTFDQLVTLAPTLLILDLVDGHQIAWDLLARVGSEASTRDIHRERGEKIVTCAFGKDGLGMVTGTIGEGCHTAPRCPCRRDEVSRSTHTMCRHRAAG